MFISNIPFKYISDNGREVIRIEIPLADWENISSMRETWACEQKPGAWGASYVEDAVGTGLKGEVGTAVVLEAPIDIEPLAVGTGNGSDFVVTPQTNNDEGIKITVEVKTKTGSSQHESLLVRSLTDGGNEVPLRSDVYIAAKEVITKHSMPNHVVVHLMGWCEKRDLLAKDNVKAYMGKHKNKDIPYIDLNLMRALLKELS